MGISYGKNKHGMCFIEANGVRSNLAVCSLCGIKIEEYMDLFKKSGGRYSSKWGHYFPKEDNAINFCMLLTLIKE